MVHLLYTAVCTQLLTGLPFDTESSAIKVCKYFHIYIVRVAELKEFYEFASAEHYWHHLSLLGHLDIFSGLCFLSQGM